MGKDLICMKIRQIKSLISDARYLSIIKVLLEHDNILAIYFIRLTIGFNLTVSKKLIRKIDKFWAKVSNPLQKSPICD
jgi:hypothetical protein